MHKLNDDTGIGPILGSTSCKYKFPLAYPDTVSVGAKIVGIEDDCFAMKYVVMSHRKYRLAAESFGVVVMYNYHVRKKTAIPESIRRRISELEKI